METLSQPSIWVPQGGLHLSPILKHPGPSKLYIVEVYSFETGVGEMLSQRFGKKSKLHPMAFFLKKLSTAKCNYDTGNRELLALKLPM